ncbi:MAG: PKD domain-containing protein, partial [Candidatus Lokiarchaeota archaeon]|nr:PKD domain-containing protein [Candidatus Lokiarchaeota archaeon]
VHAYASPGVYTVNLTVLDANGDDDVEIKTNYITVYADTQPKVKFLVNQSTIIEGQSIRFTYNGSGGNAPLTFYWDFGDGTSSSKEEPIHQYVTNGIYTVNLTVIDLIGDIGIKIEYIIVLEDLVPIANFSIDGTYFIEGRPVQFLFTGSGGNAPLMFYWDFGDGSNSTEQDPAHVYGLPGTYTVNLTITDANGDRATVTMYVLVNTLTDAPSFPAELIFGAFLVVGIVTLGGIVIRRKKKATQISIGDIPLAGGKLAKKTELLNAKSDFALKVDHYSQIANDGLIPKIVDKNLEAEELAQTESELDIEKQVFLCIVHEGPVEGQNVYICPHCQAFYCKDCVNRLREQGEKCKSCQNDFT